MSNIDKWLFETEKLSSVTREAIEAMQLQKLNELFAHCKKNSAYYNYLPDHIDSLSELESIRFTTEDDLISHGNLMLLVSQSEVGRVITTSGTSGKSKRLFFTEAELSRTVSFFACGISEFVAPGDRTLIWMPDSGTDGLCSLIKRAVSTLGAAAVISDVGHTYKEICEMILENNINTIIAMPVPLLALSKYARAVSIKLNIKGALISADACLDSVIRGLEKNLGCPVFPHYGSREMGMGGAITCRAFDGMHIRENDLLFEIVSADGDLLPLGQYGELVVTTLSRRAMPLIRYKTGDITRLFPDNCACHSHVRRMDKAQRRAGLIATLDIFFMGEENVLDFEAEMTGGKLKISFVCLDGKTFDTLGIEADFRLFDKEKEKPLYNAKRFIKG